MFDNPELVRWTGIAVQWVAIAGMGISLALSLSVFWTAFALWVVGVLMWGITWL